MADKEALEAISYEHDLSEWNPAWGEKYDHNRQRVKSIEAFHLQVSKEIYILDNTAKALSEEFGKPDPDYSEFDRIISELSDKIASKGMEEFKKFSRNIEKMKELRPRDGERVNSALAKTELEKIYKFISKEIEKQRFDYGKIENAIEHFIFDDHLYDTPIPFKSKDEKMEFEKWQRQYLRWDIRHYKEFFKLITPFDIYREKYESSHDVTKELIDLTNENLRDIYAVGGIIRSETYPNIESKNLKYIDFSGSNMTEHSCEQKDFNGSVFRDTILKKVDFAGTRKSKNKDSREMPEKMDDIINMLSKITGTNNASPETVITPKQLAVAIIDKDTILPEAISREQIARERVKLANASTEGKNGEEIKDIEAARKRVSEDVKKSKNDPEIAKLIKQRLNLLKKDEPLSIFMDSQKGRFSSIFHR